MALRTTRSPWASAARTAIFEGSYHYRLIFFTTPVDDETLRPLLFDLVAPRRGRRPATRSRSITASRPRSSSSDLWDDLEIWRYQVYVETPAFAKQDAKPYGALRKWARQFYELEPV